MRRDLIAKASLALALVVAGGSFTGCDDEEPGPGDGGSSDAAKDTASPDGLTAEASGDARVVDGGADVTTSDAPASDAPASDAPASDAPPADAPGVDASPPDAGVDAATDGPGDDAATVDATVG